MKSTAPARLAQSNRRQQFALSGDKLYNSADAAWRVPMLEIASPRDPAALSDIFPLFERLDSAFGRYALARLLDVSSGTITNWKARRHVISPLYAKRIIDLHDVMVRALQVFPPNVAMDWLVGREPFLDEARPIDVLAKHGAAPLICALDAFETLSYA